MPWTQIIGEKKRFDYSNENRDCHLVEYIEGIRETLEEAMRIDKRIFLMGQGVNDQTGMFGITNQLVDEFGHDRVMDTPISENGLTGVAIGAAMSGLHPVYFHIRDDFLLLTMDQIVNHATKYSYMSGGQFSVPLIIYAMTGQGWGSGAQHSQALQGLFMHIPGLKIMMPTTPYDAKGLLISALADHNPVLFLDHKRLHNQEGYIPNSMYKVPFGKGMIRREGKDITIIGISIMLFEALDAAEILDKEKISVEVIDLRSLKPFDIDLISDSVKKTGRLVIADTGWRCGGVSAEIASCVYEKCFKELKCPIERVSTPDIPTPAAYTLENVYYKTSKDICEVVRKILR